MHGCTSDPKAALLSQVSVPLSTAEHRVFSNTLTPRLSRPLNSPDLVKCGGYLFCLSHIRRTRFKATALSLQIPSLERNVYIRHRHKSRACHCACPFELPERTLAPDLLVAGFHPCIQAFRCLSKVGSTSIQWVAFDTNC